MGGFQSLTRLPEVQFRTSGGSPPSSIYITPNDRLLIEINNSAGAPNLHVDLRMLSPQGEIISSGYLCVPSSDRTLNTYFYDLPEGYLLGCVVYAASGIRRGQTWAAVALIRGGPSAFHIPNLVVEGYVATGRGLTWPGQPPDQVGPGGGWLRALTGTDPAAGAQVSETVPTGAVWRLKSLLVTFTTDATVADRYPCLTIDDGAVAVYRGEPVAKQTAGTSLWYGAGDGLPREASVSNTAHWSLPGSLVLDPGYRIRTDTIGMAAGDNYTAPQLLVEEWVQP